MTRREIVLLLLFAFLFGGMLFGVFFLVSRIEALRGAERELSLRAARFEQQSAERLRQIEVFKRAIAGLERYQLEIPENEVDFYAWVQRELMRNGVRSNVMRPASSPPGRSAVQVDFEGPYYAFARTISDWRTQRVALRLSSVTMNAVDGDTVRGVAIVESVLK